jgi:S-adenosylmethionine hydrolase
VSRFTITLTTDFGIVDPYVGIMRGVILNLNPLAQIVDITHAVRPQSIHQAAFLIRGSYHYFPKESIHVVVVDPGVGTSRRAIILTTPDATFIAPDNGVLTHVIKAGASLPVGGLPRGHKAYSLNNPAYWRHPVSGTFHGRDIFAPIAAHISLGKDPNLMGEAIDNLTLLQISCPFWDGDVLDGKIVHIDRFGNLVTDIKSDLLLEGENPGQGKSVEIQIGGARITGLSNSYADGKQLMGICGSFGTLEIAARNSSAASTLNVDLGDTVRVLSRPLPRR